MIDAEKGSGPSTTVNVKKQNHFIRNISITSLIFFIICVIQLKFDWKRLWTGSIEFIKSIGLMLPPDFTFWREVLLAALESLQVAIVGTVFAIIIALVLAFPAADNLTPHRILSVIIKGIASLLRAIPTLIWALIFIVAVGLGPFPGILAITVGAAGMLIKVFTQSIEEIDDGIIEALKATGANWISIVIHAVIPTVITALLSWMILRFEADIGESTILGAVGAGGIGWELTHAMRLYHFDQAFFVALVIFVMVFSVEIITNRFKMRIQSH